MLVLDTTHLVADGVATTGSAAPQLDVQGLALLIGVFIPLVVAAITKKYSAAWVKVAANIVLVTVAAVVAVYVQDSDGNVSFWQIVNALIQTFIASIAAYKGLWKTVEINDKIAPTSGLGSNHKVD